MLELKDISYEELKGSTLRLAITATVDNPNAYKVQITNANMDLRLKDRVLGKVTQIEQIELLGRTQKDYTIRISIELKDILSNAMSIYRIFQNDDTKDLNLTGTVKVKALSYSKTIKVDNLTFQ